MDTFNFTVTAETASALRDWFDEQNREFIEDLLDGKGQFTLEHGDRKVMVAPVRRGRWNVWYHGEDGFSFNCSECGTPIGWRTKYCPGCGARMEEQG